MSGFFTRFGKGILYVLVCPLFVAALGVVGVIGLIGFLVLFFKSLVLFFTGRSLKDDLPEDIKAKEILETLKAKEETMQTPIQPEVPVINQVTPQVNIKPEIEVEPNNSYFQEETKFEQEPPIEYEDINIGGTNNDSGENRNV